MSSNYIILGAGVIGLTTALELHSRYPHSTITIVARFLPGDRDATYTSPWAGANWLSVATDNGRQESWDRITYLKFQQLATRTLERLQGEVKRQGIEIRRGMFDSIDELFTAFPSANAYFNCTGLGAYSLKGVEDKSVYPTRGQIMLVQSPKTPMTRMYFRSPQRVNKDTTYVFPRGPHNGVVLGGVRLDNDWSGDVDLEFAEDIKRRCCALAPELGKPEDLKVIYHGVGLRPSRKGGARLEREMFGEHLVIHNYGAGGAGYQASWGMAKEAVDLLQKSSRL
ncbi:putative D-amino acid oxidase, partial [Aureobasidium melanogenum]